MPLLSADAERSAGFVMRTLSAVTYCSSGLPEWAKLLCSGVRKTSFALCFAKRLRVSAEYAKALNAIWDGRIAT